MEKHPGFPQRATVAFVKVNRPGDVSARVWERNAKETASSGTGAAAIAVAGALTGRTQRRLVVRFTHGDLEIHWDRNDNHVYLTCAVVNVYQGEWPDHTE
jgi:diaminopimelate epimerase